MKLKPGCLAEVLARISDGQRTNQGRIVTVMRQAVAADFVGYVDVEDEVCWLVEAPALCLFNRHRKFVRTTNARIFYTSLLRPISDPDVPVGETVAEILKAPLPVEA